MKSKKEMNDLGDRLLEDFLKGDPYKEVFHSLKEYCEHYGVGLVKLEEQITAFFKENGFSNDWDIGTHIRYKFLGDNRVLVMGTVPDFTLNPQSSPFEFNSFDSYELVNEIDSCNETVYFSADFADRITKIPIPITIKLYKIKKSEDLNLMPKIWESCYNLFKDYKDINLPVKYPENFVDFFFALSQIECLNYRNLLDKKALVSKKPNTFLLEKLLGEIKNYSNQTGTRKYIKPDWTD